MLKKSKQNISKTDDREIEVTLVEQNMRYYYYGPVTIKVRDYPELVGLSIEEIKAYIDENCHLMKSTNGDYDSLQDELQDCGSQEEIQDNPDQYLVEEV